MIFTNTVTVHYLNNVPENVIFSDLHWCKNQFSETKLSEIIVKPMLKNAVI